MAELGVKDGVCKDRRWLWLSHSGADCVVMLASCCTPTTRPSTITVHMLGVRRGGGGQHGSDSEQAQHSTGLGYVS